MQSFDIDTGQPIAGMAHLRQSIRDILTTPIGSRVMRPEYGSRLFELIDASMNGPGLSRVVAATAEALDQWEPRLKVTRITPQAISPGKLSIDIEGVYLETGRTITFQGIQI